jgi:phenylpropionate dioxygenase-like ring-hydroxylating dioxygenase large terminal subunit
MKFNQCILPKYYCSKKINNIEFNKIFNKNWFFVGMEDDLINNNDFLTLEIFGYPIVLQNFKGVIKAFENICPHRNNKIQTDKYGKRPFVCKYHNWAFDQDGKPNKKPLETLFDVNSELFDSVKVNELKIEKAGKFIFVTLNNSSDCLNDYLGDFYGQLNKISDSINSKFYFEDSIQKANWKLIVENVIEAYHCPSIHQNTLASMGFCSLPEENQFFFKGHSVADYPKKTDFKEKKVLKYLENRVFKHSSFKHFFIFPNLFISSTEGKNIYIGNLLPINKNKSTLRKRFYDVNFQLGCTPNELIHEAYLEIVKSSINSILDEDQIILEEIQKVIKFSKKNHEIGKLETRIKYFHEHYNNILNG